MQHAYLIYKRDYLNLKHDKIGGAKSNVIYNFGRGCSGQLGHNDHKDLLTNEAVKKIFGTREIRHFFVQVEWIHWYKAIVGGQYLCKVYIHNNQIF